MGLFQQPPTAVSQPCSWVRSKKQRSRSSIHKLTSIRHALSAQKVGGDAVTMLGFGLGGQVGMDNVSNFILIPQAVRRLNIPVIVGDGIAEGRGLLGALAMGAEAVLLATAFFATEESPVHRNIKDKIVDAQETDTSLIMSSIKNPMRYVHNKMVDKALEMEGKGATLQEIISAVAGGKGRLAYESGDTETMPIVCGQAAGTPPHLRTHPPRMEAGWRRGYPCASGGKIRSAGAQGLFCSCYATKSISTV